MIVHMLRWSAGPAWAAPGALLAGRDPVVVLAACCPPGGLLWALWAVLVPWCLPSSVQVVRGCVAVPAAVVVCCAAVDAVPPGRLLGAAADRWRVSWPVCRGPAMVQRGRGCLRAASAAMDRAGRGLLSYCGALLPFGSLPQLHSTFSGGLEGDLAQIRARG